MHPESLWMAEALAFTFFPYVSGAPQGLSTTFDLFSFSQTVTTYDSAAATTTITISHPKVSSTAVATNPSACWTVSSSVSAYQATAIFGMPALPTISAELAWDCIQSVPIDLEKDKAWVSSLEPYMRWQTTTAYLKNPPEGYMMPAIDIWAEHARILASLEDNSYKNEWELSWDVYKMFQGAYDGHFQYIPNLLGIFSFQRSVPLVSISDDGKELPQIYAWTDVVASQSSSFIASAVTQINGQDVVDYLSYLSRHGRLQDLDALYNDLFFSLARFAQDSDVAGQGGFAYANRVYPNATTTLTFDNGTTHEYDNVAHILGLNFQGVDNGLDVYDKYVNPKTPAETIDQLKVSATINTLPYGIVSGSEPEPSTQHKGYPVPITADISNFIDGYYLGERDYEDVAILSLTRFEANNTTRIDDYKAFRTEGLEFLHTAHAKNKTKLIIDLSGNGGGWVLQSYALFMELFPGMKPNDPTRFRAHETFNIIGEAFSASFSGCNDPKLLKVDGYEPFDYCEDLNNEYKHFTSWEEKYGPFEHEGDNFTSIIRFDLDDPRLSDQLGDRINPSKAGLWAPEDIILVYDGHCASTCAIFTELMTIQAGVKTVVLGGRPSHDKQQAVGGVKGAQVQSWSVIRTYVQEALKHLQNMNLFQYQELPLHRGYGSSVNLRDNLRTGDTSQTPLQFFYEPAGCRMFYTPEMIVNVTAIWKAVYDTQWGGKSNACVDRLVGAPEVEENGQQLLGEKQLSRKLSPEEAEELLELVQKPWGLS